MSYRPTYNEQEMREVIARINEMLSSDLDIQINDAGHLNIPPLLVYDRAAAEKVVREAKGKP